MSEAPWPLPRSVYLVGRGRMAGALSAALTDADVPFTVLPSRALTAALSEVERDGNPALWLLCVRDDAIAGTASLLAPSLRRHDRVFHLAGMRGLEELRPAHDAGCAIGAFHPLLAVADPARPPSLAGACFSLQGDDDAHRAAVWFAHRVGARVLRLGPTDRARYHAAAALVASGGVALAQGAAQLLARSTPRLAPNAAAQAVASLLRSVAHNVETVGVDAALASPLLRGDTDTLALHLERMSVVPAARALYHSALTLLLGTLSTTGAVPPAVLERARALLEPSR